MQALWTWWGVAALIAAGYAVGVGSSPGAWGGSPEIILGLVGIAWSGAAATILGGVRRGRGRGEGQARPPVGGAAADRRLRGAAVLLALAWGLSSGRADAAMVHEAAAAWPIGGLVWMEVEGASHPGPSCRFVARSADAGAEGARSWVSAPPSSCPLAAGDMVAVFGPESRVPARLPGGPDPHVEARRNGADYALRVGRVYRGRPGSSGYWRRVSRLRQHAWETTRGVEADAFVAAAVLGMPRALSPSARRALRRAGVGHLIAVSGLHVGLVALIVQAIAMRVFDRCSLPVRGAVLVTALVVAAFVGLTGAAAPAVRAGLMVSIAGVGVLVGRPVHGPTVLGLAAAAMLGLRPAWATDPGFQLSLVAMVVVVVGRPRGLLAQTWRIGWAVLPISLLHFGVGSPYALVANVLLVPLFTAWILPWGVVGWSVSGWGGTDALIPARAGARVVLYVAEEVARWPMPTPWILAGTVAVLLAVSVALRRRKRISGHLVPPLAGVATVVVVLLPTARVGRPEVPWFAVGTSRRPALVVMAGPGEACLRGVSGDPDRWPAQLRALGIERVVAIDGRSLDDPGTRALVDALEQARMWRPRGGTPRRPVCPVVGPVATRHARAECAPLGSTVTVVTGPDPAGATHCFARDGWTTMISSPQPESATTDGRSDA